MNTKDSKAQAVGKQRRKKERRTAGKALAIIQNKQMYYS